MTTAAARTVLRVRALLGRRRNVVERLVMGGHAFMVDGAMCCSVGRAGLLVRVDDASRDALLATRHVRPMVLGGRTMRAFVRVAPAGYRTTAALAEWLERGVRAARSGRRGGPSQRQRRRARR